MKLISLSLSLVFLAFVSQLSAADKTIPGVGAVSDPSGDSTISGDAAKLTISIPAGDHTLDRERSKVTAPRILQEVTGDFTVEVTISGDYPENASTEVEGRRPFQGAGLLLVAGADTYIRFERAQVKITEEEKVVHVSYPSWEARFEGKQLRSGGGGDGPITTPTSRLRLTRTGNKMVAAISEDGTSWRDLDPIILKLPETLQIGVAAGHNTTSGFSVTFANYVLTPMPKAGK